MFASNTSGLKVLLMTDLVGSVMLQQRLGAEAYAELKAQHDALVTGIVNDAPSGEILEQTGDGFFIVFANVKDALRVALTLQARIAHGDWPHERPQVRIGVHLGEVTPTVDQATGHARYAGINVSLTARIMDLAAGGQILVSRPVYENGEVTLRAHPPVEGLPTPALRWKKHGRFAFKGLKERAQVYEVGGVGLAPFKTPQGGAKARRATLLSSVPVWLGVAAAVVLLVAAVFLFRGSESSDTTPAGPSSASASAVNDTITIAVLPFSNFGGEDNVTFTAGVHEDILTTLAQLSQLQVISRTSVQGYVDTVKNIREIGRELGATHLVEGSIRRAGDRVRVTVQLIEAATDRHLWADKFDRELQDVFAIQSEIATRIATELLDRLSPEQAAKLERRPTANVETYDAYNRARELWRNRTFVTIDYPHESVVAELEQATLLDPSFAEAWSLLSQVYSNWVFNAFETNNVHLESARFALRQVQRLAPDSTDAYLAEAYFHYWGNRDFDTALSPLVKARLQSPNNAEIIMAEAYILRRKGRFTDAIQLLEQAIKLDPLNRSLFDDFLSFLSILADYDRAEAQLRLALERFSDDGALHRGLGLVEFMRDPSPANRDALAATMEAFPLDLQAVASGEPFNLMTVLGDLTAGFDLFEEIADDPEVSSMAALVTRSGMMIFGYQLGKDEIAKENAGLFLQEVEAIPPEALNRISQLRQVEGLARRIRGEPFNAREIATAVDAALTEADDAFLFASSHIGRVALWSLADMDHAVDLFLEGPPYPGVQDQLPNATLLIGLMPEFFRHPRIEAVLRDRPAWKAFIDQAQPALRSYGP
jgi:TolB-like protein/class 3 adenylate cyclase